MDSIDSDLHSFLPQLIGPDEVSLPCNTGRIESIRYIEQASFFQPPLQYSRFSYYEAVNLYKMKVRPLKPYMQGTKTLVEQQVESSNIKVHSNCR